MHVGHELFGTNVDWNYQTVGACEIFVHTVFVKTCLQCIGYLTPKSSSSWM